MSDKETAPRVDNRPCDDCGNENPVWFADNEVWNAAVPERVGYICPNCFIKRADPAVTNTGWKLVPEISPSPTSIASGMVWYQDNVLKQTHKFEGTSEQASPTPDYEATWKCPACGYYFQGWNFARPQKCPNDGTPLIPVDTSRHSSAGTPKGTK